MLADLVHYNKHNIKITLYCTVLGPTPLNVTYSTIKCYLFDKSIFLTDKSLLSGCKILLQAHFLLIIPKDLMYNIVYYKGTDYGITRCATFLPFEFSRNLSSIFTILKLLTIYSLFNLSFLKL